LPESGNLMGMVGAFIAVAIMLGIGTLILGGATTDCSNVSGYDSTTPASSTGWAASCISNAEQSQAGYGLLMITLIVIAAVVVLSVVRMLG
jgi:hypothetical protein